MHNASTQQTFSHAPQQPYVNKHLAIFCTLAVFAYALSRFWIGAKTSAYFEAAFLLPFYYVVFKNRFYFKKQFLTWLVIAMLAIPVLQFFIQYNINPELALKYQGVDKLFRLTFFIAAAFWLSFHLKFINLFIIVNLIGLAILVATQPNLANYIARTIAGKRSSLGEINAQFIAVYCSLAITAITCLVSQAIKITKKKLKYSALIISLITAATAIFILIGSQTRAAYLGLMSCLIIAIWLATKHKQKNTLKIKPHYIIAGLFVTTLATTLVMQSNAGKRITAEIQRLDINNTASINKLGGGRGELAIFATHKITQQPLLGYGGEARKDIISNATELSDRTRKHLLHLHNSWLDFGLAYGLPGIALLTLLLGYLVKLIYQKWHSQVIPTHIAMFSLLGIVFLAVANLFESYLFFWQGGYLLVWVCVPALALCFKKTHGRVIKN